MKNNGSDLPVCSSPIDAAILADYWLEKLTGPEQDAVEEHLMSCDGCGEQLRRIIRLADGLRDLARSGTLRMIVSDGFVKRAAENGAQVREYSLPAGGRVECTVTAEDDFLIGRMATDITNATRVDLSMCDANGVERTRLPDIPFTAGPGSVVLQESISFMKDAPSMKVIARLVAVDDSGKERQLGEYTFNHTRTIPGPGRFSF